ncbi:MAG TPA: S8 family peptidase [bacterium]|nr:S8 family peptidase [bacterium]
MHHALLNSGPRRIASPFLAALLALALSACSGSTPTGPASRDTAALSAGASGLQAQTQTAPVNTVAAGPTDFTAGQILVKFKPSTTVTQRAAAHTKLGTTVLNTIPGIDWQVIQVPAGREQALIDAYRRESTVFHAEPDYTLRACLTPNDTSFGTQWDMTKIGAPAAWDVTTGDPAIKVAVLDTGIDLGHADVAAKVVLTKNFTSTTSTSVQDGNGHGTHTAGTVAAITNNARGVAGVGFNTALMIGKVLSNSGSGSLSWSASGLVWATDNGAKVVNLSLGAYSGSLALGDAVNYAWNHGVVVCCAAGNNNTSSLFYPAAYTNAIAVGSTDSADRKSSFSNWGSWLDVAAPGSSIYSTYKNGTYRTLSGTSMASPHVAGLAALLWATPHGSSAANVRARIEGQVDPYTTTSGRSIGTGRISAVKAVSP